MAKSPDTKEAVDQAVTDQGGGDPIAIAGAVAEAAARAAPAGEIDQQLGQHADAIGQLAAVVGLTAPIAGQLASDAKPAAPSLIERISALEDIAHSVVDSAEAVAPQNPILARITLIEETVHRALAAFAAHFGAGRITGLPEGLPNLSGAPLPAPPPGTTTGPAPSGPIAPIAGAGNPAL
jgi:hypothetical protein